MYDYVFTTKVVNIKYWLYNVYVLVWLWLSYLNICTLVNYQQNILIKIVSSIERNARCYIHCGYIILLFHKIQTPSLSPSLSFSDKYEYKKECYVHHHPSVAYSCSFSHILLVCSLRFIENKVVFFLFDYGVSCPWASKKFPIHL